jgi:hypothetical protein
MRSLVETLDLPSQRLARPAHPVRLARALQAAAVGGLVWAVAMAVPLAGGALATTLGRSLEGTTVQADIWISLAMLVGALTSTIGLGHLARRDDRVLSSELGNAGRWLVFGGGIWLAASIAQFIALGLGLDRLLQTSRTGIMFECLAVAVIGGSIASVGMRRILAVLGQRCRRYRVAAHARQSTELLATTAAILLVAALASHILPSLGYELLGISASAVTVISGAALVLGVVYFMLNSWWIANALLKPPPSMTDVVHIRREGASGESPN